MDIKEISHHRSPVFSIEEVQFLINLVDKHKSVVLNRSSTSSALQVKESTWSRITKIFNSANLGHKRNVETLQMKWANLKRNARKVSQNVLAGSEIDKITNQVFALMHEAENFTEPLDCSKILSDESDAENNDYKMAINGTEIMMDDSGSDSSETELQQRHRDSNFSPNECNLLFKCVKEEMNVLFSKDNKKQSIQQKNLAWLRVTESFNRLSPTKRTEQVLKTKFQNMKKVVKKIGLKNYLKRHTVPENIINQIKNSQVSRTLSGGLQIKIEPLNDGRMDDYSIDNADNIEHKSPPHDPYIDLDPLNMVIAADSGTGSTDMSMWNNDTKEIIKMKLDLLKYEMETAKLKRIRVEEALKAEMAAREHRALEAALRLRAARLEVAAAEAKLPVAHPALIYSGMETKAKEYIQQLDNT